jgi:hypothetical protein
MLERMVLWQGVFYEGNAHAVRTISPQPVISQASCNFIVGVGSHEKDELVFREDSFDPVTRIRRGRLYVNRKAAHVWDQVNIDNGMHLYNWGNWKPDASYEPWKPDTNFEKFNSLNIQIGGEGLETKWRIVGLEKITIGHVLLTMRATSLLGVIPELANAITDKDGNVIDKKPIRESLDSLVDAFHRQQATSTVDMARETARVILRWWCGDLVEKMDLTDAIKGIPKNRYMAQHASHILAKLHSRGKSSEQERQAEKGSPLRPVIEEDAECAVNLVGLLLREIGWAAP